MLVRWLLLWLLSSLLERFAEPQGRRGAAPAPAELRVATYNIRFLGREPTDLGRVARVLAAVDPAVVAIEEVVRDEPVHELAQRLSVSGRAYHAAVAECGGRSGLRVAFVYDRSRVECRGVREFAAMEPDGEGACAEGDRAALAARFARVGAAPDEADTTLVALHLAARAEPERVEQRRAQWRRLFAIRARLEREGNTRVLLLGDANSTGWRDDAHGERSFIEAEAARASMVVATGALACSEYFRTGERAWDPSMLDHIVAPPDAVVSGSARVHGYCEQLACRPWREQSPPEEYTHASDHCPVSVALRFEQ